MEIVYYLRNNISADTVAVLAAVAADVAAHVEDLSDSCLEVPVKFFMYNFKIHC